MSTIAKRKIIHKLPVNGFVEKDVLLASWDTLANRAVVFRTHEGF